MPATLTEQTVHALEIVKDERIDAPIDVVFATILEQLGPMNEAPGTGSMPMKLEAWPGGRWYRDLGNASGHFWGTVQSIKPPILLELCGPLFMSYPAVSTVRFQLSAVDGLTHLHFTHRAMGQISHDADIEEAWSGIDGGWEKLMSRIRSAR